MPWQLKNPTFSFSLRPILSKHWLVSTFLIWRKESGEIFLKILPDSCRNLQLVNRSHSQTATEWFGLEAAPKARDTSHYSTSMREFGMIIPNLSKSPFLFSLFTPKNNKISTWGMCFEAWCCSSPLIYTIFPWI